MPAQLSRGLWPLFLLPVLGSWVNAAPPVSQSCFLYDKAPFPACHAATLCEVPGGLLAAFFGGTDEGEADVGIWICHRHDGQWQAPVLVAEGLEPTSRRLPCWNPVLVPLPDQRLLRPEVDRKYKDLFNSLGFGATGPTKARTPNVRVVLPGIEVQSIGS